MAGNATSGLKCARRPSRRNSSTSIGREPSRACRSLNCDRLPRVRGWVKEYEVVSRRVLTVLAALAVLPAGIAGAQGKAPAKPTKVAEGKFKKGPGGLKYAILKEGSGAVAKAGPVTVHYTGWLTNGSKFDSSLDRGQPFEFPLGGGQVIKGWDEGVKGMKVGEKRQLVVPPDMGYGPTGTPGGPIPPNATLIFEVELLKVNGK